MFTPQSVGAKRTSLHYPRFCQLLTFTSHTSSSRGTQPQRWFICSELYSAPSPSYQAVWGCSLEPSWVYLPPAASHNLVAPLPTSRVLHHAAGACSAICQHHLPDLLSQDYLLPNPHHFYQGFKACKQGVTIWKKGSKIWSCCFYSQHLFFLLPASLSCSNCSGRKRKFQYNFWLLFYSHKQLQQNCEDIILIMSSLSPDCPSLKNRN